jgi:hypothetical protein
LSSRIGLFHILRSLVTLISLIGAFLVSAGLVIYFAYGGREVMVPELIGKSQAEAEKELSGYGLRLRITHSAPSARVTADLISEQTPGAGATVKTGQSVRVIISTGSAGISESPTPIASPAAVPRPEATKSPVPRPKPDGGKDKDKDKDSGKDKGLKAGTGSSVTTKDRSQEKSDNRDGDRNKDKGKPEKPGNSDSGKKDNKATTGQKLKPVERN